MSTGDQTEYLRGKMAERGNMKTPSFTRDGFDAWAESERPARTGGSEKIPAERQMMPSRIVGGVRYHQGSGLHGGISPEEFLSYVPKLFEFFNTVKSYTANVKEDLRGEDMPAKFKPTAVAIADTLEMIGLGKKPHQALYESCMLHMSPKGKRGGAKDWTAWFKELGDKLKKAYEWFIKHKTGIHYILNMKSLNPPGFDYPKQLSGFMKQVGMAKPPSVAMLNNAVATAPSGSGRCGCRGGAYNGIEKFNPDRSEPPPGTERHVDQRSPELRALDNYYFPKIDAASSNADKEALWKEYDAQLKALRGGFSSSSGDSGIAYANDYSVSAPVRQMKRPSGMKRLEEYEEEAVDYAPRRAMGRAGGARNARAQIVKKVMQQQGLSLPMASKYVKEHGLY